MVHSALSISYQYTSRQYPARYLRCLMLNAPLGKRGEKLLKQFVLGQYMELVAAVRFLSVLPMPGSAQLFDKNEVAPSLLIGCEYFPLVGLLLAVLLWLLVLVLAPLVPQLALAALLFVALVILTAGLPLYGPIDSRPA